MSSLDDLESPWGQLVEIDTEEDGDLTPLVGNQFSIGRGKDEDLVIPANRFVSTVHCVVVRGEWGRAYIKDTSTNGTLLNGARLERLAEVKLASDDIIRVVNRKDKPEFNVAFKFSYLTPPEDEQDLTLSYEHTLEDEPTIEIQPTIEYDPEEMCDGGEAGPSESKVEESQKPGGSGKKRQLESPEGVPESKKIASEEVGKTSKTADSSVDGSQVVIKRDDVESDSSAKPTVTKQDSIAETLTCQICQEILHDCISLQPCMHSYCAGCYSEWMGSSDTCPACRNKVERISKNHMVNNLVEAYLRTNPDKKRPEEDLKELDAKNKITKDMLYPKRKRRHYDYDDDDEYDDSSTDDEDDSLSLLPPPPFFTFTTHGVPTPPPLFLCRQCPSYVPPPSHSTPSLPTPPPFTCSPTSNHVLCLCCLQPMPDRRHDTDLSIPPQKCDICGQAYCHMYWGCRKPGCHGCLDLFKDMDFPDSILSGILNNGNAYESRILKDYMEGKSLSIKDVLTSCCAKLEAGEYVCTDSRTSRMSPSVRTCYKCALKNFRDLVYSYRKDIPDSELSAAVTRRSNCYWGKNCRTQLNKPLHAEKFNHICDQTRR